MLTFITIRLAWIARGMPYDPDYILSGWRFVAVAAAGSVAFLIWPMILRWAVAPYFLFTAIGGLTRIFDYEFGIWVGLSMALLFFQGALGVLLFRMKKRV